MVRCLSERCAELLEKYKDDISAAKKYVLIQEILKNDNAFFEIDIETAYSILRDLEFKESEIKGLYLQLIDSKKYKNMQN